jgi:GT2 family glycosyltransferase
MKLAPNSPKISIVIPNYNGEPYLKRCLQSLLAQTCPDMEIVVVDNASKDRSVEMAGAIAPEVVLLQIKGNLGFAGGANIGVKASRGEWIAILNNDTEVAPDWLHECLSALQQKPEAAFFACRILDFGNRTRLFSAGDCFLRAGIGYRRGQEQQDRPDYRHECEIFSPCGCAAIYRKQVFEKVGGFDERFFAYLEDVDLGLRLQAAGYRGYYIPKAEVYHHGAATSGGEFSSLSVRMYTRNALLILLKSMPAGIALRCMPMICLAQATWLFRSAAHGKTLEYVRGIAGALRLAPPMIKDRAKMRDFWRGNSLQFWEAILKSESLAGQDFASVSSEAVSLFLKWYFRLFLRAPGYSRNRNYV